MDSAVDDGSSVDEKKRHRLDWEAGLWECRRDLLPVSGFTTGAILGNRMRDKTDRMQAIHWREKGEPLEFWV